MPGSRLSCETEMRGRWEKKVSRLGVVDEGCGPATSAGDCSEDGNGE